MAFVAGSVVVILILLIATGAAIAIVTWLVLKWVVIVFGILGGIAGGLLFGEKAGVFIGAIIGAVFGIGLLTMLGTRNDE